MDKGEKKTAIKKKIRDTQRLLARDELPETVRLTKERVLRSLQRELQQKQREKKSKKVAKKYRMVKFFERRKVTRKLKSRLKELSTCEHDEQQNEIRADIQRLRRELNYVAHYPDSEKYVALYPSTDTTSSKALAHRDKLMSQIVLGVESGELSDASQSIFQSVRSTTKMRPADSESLEESMETAHNRTAVLRQGDVTSPSGDCVAESNGPFDGALSKKRGGGTCKHRRRDRPLAPVDQEPDSESELHLESQRHNFLEDDFFV